MNQSTNILTKHQKLWLFILAALFVLLAWWLNYTHATLEEYASFTRPDGHYRVVVIRKKVLTALMPGQASDAPGEVWLYNQQGNVLYKTDIQMVQLVDHVDWQDKKAYIKLIADWDLPD